MDSYVMRHGNMLLSFRLLSVFWLLFIYIQLTLVMMYGVPGNVSFYSLNHILSVAMVDLHISIYWTSLQRGNSETQIYALL